MLMTAIADVSKGQTDMAYKGELQIFTKQIMRYYVCPGEACHTTILESAIKMVMSRDRSTCGVTYYVSIYY